MKHTFIIAAILCFSLSLQAQLPGNLKSAVNNVLGSKDSSLKTTDVVSGLKDALKVGTERSTTQLSAVDGYFKNAAIKILMPPEAQKAENTLRKAGLGSYVDSTIKSMNRAAEDAAKSATPIFVDAIKQMTFEDAWNILRGSDSAATLYLRNKTSPALMAAFKPIIDQSLAKIDATKYWNSTFSTYNKLPFVKKVNPDLAAYVTQKALWGIFYQVALEEQKIRKDPAAQTTDILKKVFGGK